MARPRTNNSGLPACVYEKRGRYYLVKRGRWFNLGEDRDRAIELARCFIPPATVDQLPILEYALRLVARARQNARSRGIDFKLTKEDVRALMDDSDWKCAVTRTPFSLERLGTTGDRPFAPSIDRIRCELGYERENCRIVCVATNFAMNRWGEPVLRRLARHMTAPNRIRQVY